MTAAMILTVRGRSMTVRGWKMVGVLVADTLVDVAVGVAIGAMIF